MGGSDVLAIILMVMSFAVFFQLGLSASRRISNAQDFLLSGRKVRGSHFQHTLVASGTSLATVLIFFITASKAYGIVFLVNLGTFILGQYLFFKIAEKSEVDLTTFTTLSQFVKDKSRSNKLFWIVRIITLSSFIGILFVEVLLGTAIFSYFVDIPHAELWGFIAIASLMLIYIAAGGFIAVVESDSWQYRLVLGGAVLLLVFPFLYANSEQSFSLERSIAWTASDWEVITLILNATIVNLTLPLCQLSSWQRVSATGSWKIVRENFNKGLWKIFVIWGSFIVFSLGLNGSSVSLASITELFGYLKQFDDISRLFFYPLIFVGLVSALLSTADSAAMAIIFEIEGPRSRTVTRDWKAQRIRYAFWCLLLLVLVGAGFLGLQTQARGVFIHIIFVLFSQLVVMFPLINNLLRKDSLPIVGEAENVAFVGVLVGFIAVWGISLTGMVKAELGWTQFASAIGILTSWGFIAYARRLQT